MPPLWERIRVRSVFLVLSCFLAFGQFVFSQETAEQTQDKTIYVIRSIEYRITGKTKETALEREGGFRKGERFTGREALDEYVAEKLRVLYNIRALEEEKNSIVYTLGDAEEDGAVPVYLEVSVTDSSNFVVLPAPSYDSNAGFTVSIKPREYNFLGSLSPFKFDFVWESDEKDRTSAGFLLDLALPFRAFDLNWTFFAFNEFKYYYLTDDPVYNKSALGIAAEIPVSFTTLIPGFEQGFVLHEENTKKNTFETEQYHDWYAYSKLFLDWKIPTPLVAGKFGQVVYTPGVYGTINYQFGGDVGAYRRGPVAGINQSLRFSRIDWIGNFRQGLAVSLAGNNEYNVYHENWIHSVGAQAEGHIAISKFFGISGRLAYTRWIDDFYEYGGDAIRGYKDNELDATQRLSLNLDFPFRFFRFVPSQWFDNRKLRYFDFEEHLSFFVDLMMLDTIEKNYAFKPEDIIPSVGLELITFSHTWRSFYVRGSVGWNLREWVRTGTPPSGIHREIYIGFGHFY